MNKRDLWTLHWTQPYANYRERPYMRMLHERLEEMIELELELGDFAQANFEINRIKNAKK